MRMEAYAKDRDGCDAYGKLVLGCHSRSRNSLSDVLLRGVGRTILILLMTVALVLCGTGPGFAQLADSPWPMRGHDAKRTGQSSYRGAGNAFLNLMSMGDLMMAVSIRSIPMAA